MKKWLQWHGKWIWNQWLVCCSHYDVVLMHTYKWVWASWCLCKFIHRRGWRGSNDHMLIHLLRFLGIFMSFLKLNCTKILMFMLYNCSYVFSTSSWLSSCRYHESMGWRGGWKHWLLCRAWGFAKLGLEAPNQYNKVEIGWINNKSTL